MWLRRVLQASEETDGWMMSAVASKLRAVQKGVDTSSSSEQRAGKVPSGFAGWFL